MSQTGLRGPYFLNNKTIDNIIVKASPGVYLLGYVGIGGFIPKYVGRSDDDVSEKLRNWIGGKYSKFKYDNYDSAQAAFAKECDLYHDWLGQLDNEKHPERPANTVCECPRCNMPE